MEYNSLDKQVWWIMWKIQGVWQLVIFPGWSSGPGPGSGVFVFVLLSLHCWGRKIEPHPGQLGCIQLAPASLVTVSAHTAEFAYCASSSSR